VIVLHSITLPSVSGLVQAVDGVFTHPSKLGNIKLMASYMTM